MTQKYKVVTDQGSYIVETDEPAQPDLASRQAASKATFEANLPESHVGMNLSANELKAQLGSRIGDFLHGPQEGQPGYSPSAEASNIFGMIAPGGAATEGMGLAQGLMHSPVAKGADALINALKSRLPNAAHAGAAMDTIRTAAADTPVDLSKPYSIIQRAKELENTGHGPISTGMSKMSQALQPATVPLEGQQFTVNPTRINYPQSFDFASAAKDLASTEKMSQTGMMQGQVKLFAKALQEANRDAAAQVGMGDLFDFAMKEYRQAKNIGRAMDIAKKFVIGSAIAGAMGAAGKAGWSAYGALQGEGR